MFAHTTVHNVQMYLSPSCRIFIFIVIILVHKYYINNTLIWITLHCTKYNQKLLTKQKVSWPSISCVVRTKVFCHLRYIKIRNTAIETRTTYVAWNSLVQCEIIMWKCTTKMCPWAYTQRVIFWVLECTLKQPLSNEHTL